MDKPVFTKDEERTLDAAIDIFHGKLWDINNEPEQVALVEKGEALVKQMERAMEGDGLMLFTAMYTLLMETLCSFKDVPESDRPLHYIKASAVAKLEEGKTKFSLKAKAGK